MPDSVHEQISSLDIMHLLNDIKSKIDKNAIDMSEVKNSLSQTNSNLEKIITEHNVLRDEIINLREVVNKQEKEIKFLKNRFKENNLIIYKVNEPDNETYEALEEAVINIIGLQMETGIDSSDIIRIKRIGIKTKTGNKNRPILVKLATFKMMIQVLKNGKKLAGSNISVTPDFSAEDIV
ncbi:hypothetical protein O3M35_003571 [Rhynocoris fuscipes]|uniref:Endonuclease-reverse transcriptase n=1 Tax=Rhynocoris fuscipes TaxID=488301 RepID=A0AAW1CL67_9HEMI